MKTIKIGGTIHAPAIALGCMRIGGLETKQLHDLIGTAMENGAHFFDHADIYGGGECERVFGKAVKEMGIPRDKMVVQTKCGIRQGFFDFSKGHIISSAEKALERLGMEYTDFFLLHRPDTLMEPEEVAEAFTQLHKAGKVRHFGVSNHNPAQILLLNKYLPDGLKIIINQLQFSPTNTGMVNSGLNVNMENPPAIDRDGSVLEFCRLHDITIQAWSPFQYGFFEGVFLGSEKYVKLNKEIDTLAEKYGVTPEAIVIAWILRHPANMQAIPGTTNAVRLRGICGAYSVQMTRPEWYAVYRAAGNVLP
ncbi:MAG: aldo/keto reductase [Defluviitaleaceae bacterium]|nr:aldo/keto reductase [Defluviitaleaceae bacterium]